MGEEKIVRCKKVEAKKGYLYNYGQRPPSPRMCVYQINGALRGTLFILDKQNNRLKILYHSNY